MKNKVSNLKPIFKRALNLAKTPIIIAFVVTPTRFLLELAGLPESVIFIIGLLWIALAFAVYWGIKLYNEKQAYLLLLLSLIIFSPFSRLTVAIIWWIDTTWEIGTHYNLVFDSFAQAAYQQMVYGSIIQIIPSFLLGSIIIAILRHRKSIKQKNKITEK
jgi:hypothetical protein